MASGVACTSFCFNALPEKVQKQIIRHLAPCEALQLKGVSRVFLNNPVLQERIGNEKVHTLCHLSNTSTQHEKITQLFGSKESQRALLCAFPESALIYEKAIPVYLIPKEKNELTQIIKRVIRHVSKEKNSREDSDDLSWDVYRFLIWNKRFPEDRLKAGRFN